MVDKKTPLTETKAQTAEQRPIRVALTRGLAPPMPSLRQRATA